MSRLTPDGFTKAWWVTTLSSLTAPSLAEITAGTELTPFITRTGIDIPEEGTDADSSDLSSARDKSVPSTYGGPITIELYRDDGTGGGTDAAWTALPRLTIGYLVVARFGGTGTDNAIAVSDTVETYTGRVSQRSNNRITSGETLRFTATITTSADVVEGTVAA